MADIYHFSVQTIGRQQGRSSIAAVAYRQGLDIIDDRTGIRHNFTKKQGIDSGLILAPDGAPEWVFDHEKLWNAVEASETRVNSRMAREINIALPSSLDHDQKRELLREYVSATFVADGMVADIAFHDLDSKNPHAHLMLTTRTIGPDGFGKKDRDWDRKEILLLWREDWSAFANLALEKAGYDSRIDHRSLVDQQAEAFAKEDWAKWLELERLPQKKLGPMPGPDLIAYQHEAIASKVAALAEAALYEKAHAQELANQQRQAVLDLARETTNGHKATIAQIEMEIAEDRSICDDITKKRGELNEKIDGYDLTISLNQKLFSEANRQVQAFKEEHKIALFFGWGAEKLENLRAERKSVEDRAGDLNTEKYEAVQSRENLLEPLKVTQIIATLNARQVQVEIAKITLQDTDRDLDNGITVDEREAMTLESMMQKRAERDAFLAAVPSTAQAMMDGQTQNTHKQKPRGRSL